MLVCRGVYSSARVERTCADCAGGAPDRSCLHVFGPASEIGDEVTGQKATIEVDL